MKIELIFRGKDKVSNEWLYEDLLQIDKGSIIVHGLRE